MSFRRVCSKSDLWAGEMRGVVVDGKKVLLVNVDGTFVAYANRCAHQAVELSTGKLEDCVLTCPAHEWQYDVRSGVGVNPRGARLVPYPTKVEADSVFVDVDLGASERLLVGPVLQKGSGADAILSALLEENPSATFVDRGSYVRVLVAGRCSLSRRAVERHLQTPFRLPADLELLMSSFKGRMTITESEVVWELGGGP